MSERGHFRGGGGGGGGRGGRGRGGPRGGGGGGASSQTERPKKENILDLNKYIDKQVCVKFNGGRESESFVFSSPPFFPLVWAGRARVSERAVAALKGPPKNIQLTQTTIAVVGTLKGYDQLMNLVLDDVKETMRGNPLNIPNPIFVHFHPSGNLLRPSYLTPTIPRNPSNNSPPHRRRRQRKDPLPRPDSSARHPFGAALAPGRLRGDCEPVRARR